MLRFYVRGFRLAEEDAEDLAQEAFLRFYEAMDEYRGEAEWALLEIIARNVLYNRIRSQKTAKRSANTVSIDDLQPTQQPTAPQDADYADREAARLLRKRLRTAIETLPAGQRKCLHLWREGFRYTQIAGILGITVDAVKSRLRDAKRDLERELKDDAGRFAWPGTFPEDDE